MPQNLSGRTPSQRQLRVGEIVRRALTSVLQRGEIKDPLLEKVVLSISEVAMSPDLKIATVYVTALGHNDSKPVIKALATNVKQIRARVAPLLKQMKSQPNFRFQPRYKFWTILPVLMHFCVQIKSPAICRNRKKTIRKPERPKNVTKKQGAANFRLADPQQTLWNGINPGCGQGKMAISSPKSRPRGHA